MIFEYIYGGTAVEQAEARQKHTVHWFWLLLLGLLLLIGAPVGAYHWLYRQVRPLTVWEMTGSCPPASALMKDGGEARWCFDTGKIDWKKPGEAVVLVAGKDGPRIAMVRQQDTTAPTARGVFRVLGLHEELGPDAFITDLADAQLVGVSFEEAPTFHEAGDYEVIVRLEDLSGNVGLVKTSCTILGPVSRIDMEAGEPVPPIERFLPTDTMTGRFVTDLTTVDTSVPGVHTLEVESEGQVFQTALVIHDTTPPVCTFETDIPYVHTGQALTAESLVTSASDASALTMAFDPEPAWDRQGYQTVTVAVTDAGGNRVTGQATVLISDLEPLTWEASRRALTGPALAKRFQELDESFSGEVKVARFTPRTLGCFDVNTMVDDVLCIQRLSVVDTTPPRLVLPKKPQAYLDHPVAPRALLAVAEDETSLTLSYVVEPDWTREGPQPVSIAGVDIAGNRTEIEGTVDIVQDTEPPKILGVVNQYVYIGEAVAYFAQASAIDDADGEVPLTVDNSAVDIYTAGLYPVTYRATDRAGNTAEKTVRLCFIRPTVTEEKLQAAADKVLAKIVTDDMTKGQKAYAIFRYVKDHFVNTERSNKRDWKYEAWRGLTTRRGDCFTFCAAAKVLLEKIGARTMFVIRYSGARHYWLMVDLGSGWYHFDPYNDGPSRKFECFMLTTEEVLDLYPFFWKYDHRVYPESATEKFVRDW